MAFKAKVSKADLGLPMGVDRLIREKEVESITGLGRTVRNAKIRAGFFPAPIKQLNALGLPGRTNYWLLSKVIGYVAAEIEADRERIEGLANEGLNGWLNRAVEENGGQRHA